ncbi:MAG: Immunoglobulin-like domain of bacterial spore germination [Thermoleophilia bacterium]|nr:Immunoglobulin-like domain of bacterial spore germination [Thermoleophilia bacterium]
MTRPLGSGRTVVVVALAALASLLATGCGSSDDDGSKGSTKTSTTDTTTTDTTETTTTDDDHGDPTELPDPVPEGELPPIQVTSPTSLAYVSGSFVLAGSAQVTEGALQWAILDADLKPMTQGRMTASCGAPCRGKFRARIPLAKVPVGSWELHVWTPPVADDDPPRVHDTMTPITVTAKPVTGAPDPGATPPGGVPGGA